MSKFVNERKNRPIATAKDADLLGNLRNFKILQGCKWLSFGGKCGTAPGIQNEDENENDPPLPAYLINLAVTFSAPRKYISKE
ncbi:MAG TPA: hypothetical protein VMF08_22565 [Candidatus Sulfotelmatobacter sp.]|nr:hypothetical protein [Candidatus Sulfotelmatobacter sp.]